MTNNLPQTIICDLDGTIALFGDRDPHDASTCAQDGVQASVVEILRRFNDLDGGITIVTTRDEAFRAPTIEWLEKNNIPFSRMYMRSTGDRRPDHIVKKDIYLNHILGKLNVLFVLDDRFNVCRMWYGMGLTLLRAGDPTAMQGELTTQAYAMH